MQIGNVLVDSPAAMPAPPRAPSPPRPRLVAVPQPAGAVERPGALPAEWLVLERVEAGADVIDLVLVGPNGVFAVHVDPDPRPAAVRPGHGVVREGARVPGPVKRALFGAAALRERLRHLPGDVFPYPVLVTPAPGEAGHRLGRLLVVRPGRLAEVIWSHASRPLTRSQRAAIRRVLLAG